MADWKGDDIDTEDVVLEPESGRSDLPEDDVMEAEEHTLQKIAKMREELAVCRQEKQEYMDGWQRAKADYVNLLKRFETESKGAVLMGKIKAIETLLPVFDALERAKEHGEIPEGFSGIAKQLASAFATLGLEEVGKVGEKFDPALHEALGQDSVDDETKDDTITVVLERGWNISGTIILRPAKVRVAHFG